MAGYQDPWAWANEPMRYPSVPQTNNTLQVPQNNPQQPQIMQGQPGVGQMAQQMIINRGLNAGIDAGVNAVTPAKVTAPLAPVVDSVPPVAVEQLAPIPGQLVTTAMEAGVTDAGTTAAAVEGASLASTGATLAGTGMLSAIGGPVGLIGGLLLAKQMKWI